MPSQVSVIITSYNYAPYIGEAVQSVLEQTYQDREIIVVDDGSVDHTRAVLATFGDKITCIYQSNQGKSVALNRGIAAAQGQYLAFLDSDDCWLPDSLEARMAAFDAHPQVGVVYGRTLVIDGSGASLPHTMGAPERHPGETFRSLLEGVFIPFLTFTVRRQCFEQAGAYFDPDFGATNDWELYLRLSRTCEFFYLDRPLARYRVHGSNWSGNPAIMGKQMVRVITKALSMPHNNPEVEQSKHVIYRNLYTNIGLGFVGPGPRWLALHYFARAVHVSRHPVWAVVRIVYLIAIGFLNRNSLGARLVYAIGSVKQRLNYTFGK